jgi:DNA-binding MarR family transcriptional regulator
MSTENTRIERQLTVLLRKSVRIHLSTQRGDVSLERSAYGIMCQLSDEGPQRLGALAAAFGLDPSTITRQVRDLENAGLAHRQTDPSDRRAAVLDLTPCGREMLRQSRDHRRSKLQEALSNWSSRDLSDFGRLLQEFNISMDRLGAFGVLLFTNTFVLG